MNYLFFNISHDNITSQAPHNRDILTPKKLTTRGLPRITSAVECNRWVRHKVSFPGQNV